MAKTLSPLVLKLHDDRERRLLTWTAYAAFVGIAPATLYNLLNGRPPSRLTELKLQQAWKAPKPQKVSA
jgi:predicted DNA-binding transcriptional regulator AlpA